MMIFVEIDHRALDYLLAVNGNQNPTIDVAEALALHLNGKVSPYQGFQMFVARRYLNTDLVQIRVNDNFPEIKPMLLPNCLGS